MLLQVIRVSRRHRDIWGSLRRIISNVRIDSLPVKASAQTAELRVNLEAASHWVEMCVLFEPESVDGRFGTRNY